MPKESYTVPARFWGMVVEDGLCFNIKEKKFFKRKQKLKKPKKSEK